MARGTLLLFVVCIAVAAVNGNLEGDVLANWRAMLYDPNGVLQSWDPTLVNPCTWFHVTCNNESSVTRVNLGNANLSGTLSSNLSQLANLQYLSLFRNNLTGVIPPELGNLTRLVSLDLYNNQLSGSIPPSLGNLTSLRFLRLNGNALTGYIPSEILELVVSGNLLVLNVSENPMTGRMPSTTPRGLAITTIIQDPRAS